MLPNLLIERFRGFSELNISKLSRVNLFVGTNNVGKTSILEAAEILALGTPGALLRSPQRRRELVQFETYREAEQASSIRTEIDFSHLFLGHLVDAGAWFSLRCDGDSSFWVRCEIIQATVGRESQVFRVDSFRQARLFDDGEEEELGAEGSSDLVPHLSFESHLGKQRVRMHTLARRPLMSRWQVDPGPPVNFIGIETPGLHYLGELWSPVALKPEELQVIQALRIIEPRIERVALLPEGRAAAPSFFLKLEGSEHRLPLGSVGDGLKRLLTLALHLVSAKRGYLLVDEIDTGLHYSVMENMWRLVIETARRLDVQVLATTHSLDCVRALAWVQEQYPELATGVMLHRVEAGNPETVSYTAEELATAARHHIEVR